MDNEQLQQTLRKFLRQVGVTSQQAIEKAIEQAVKDGRLQGNERLHAVMRLEVDGIDLSHTVEGDLVLE